MKKKGLSSAVVVLMTATCNGHDKEASASPQIIGVLGTFAGADPRSIRQLSADDCESFTVTMSDTWVAGDRAVPGFANSYASKWGLWVSCRVPRSRLVFPIRVWGVLSQ